MDYRILALVGLSVAVAALGSGAALAFYLGRVYERQVAQVRNELAVCLKELSSLREINQGLQKDLTEAYRELVNRTPKKTKK